RVRFGSLGKAPVARGQVGLEPLDLTNRRLPLGREPILLPGRPGPLFVLPEGMSRRVRFGSLGKAPVARGQVGLEPLNLVLQSLDFAVRRVPVGRESILLANRLG